MQKKIEELGKTVERIEKRRVTTRLLIFSKFFLKTLDIMRINAYNNI